MRRFRKCPLEINATVYIRAPRAEVFQTLSTASGWKAWFASDCRFENKIGGKVQFAWKNFGPDRVSLQDGGTIQEYSAPSRLAFTWHPGQRETLVGFDLRTRGRGTIVKLQESGYHWTAEDFQAFCGSSVGWGEALALLKFYLEHGVTYGMVPKK